VLKFPSLYRNRLIGFILGRYELEKESKKLLHTEEQFISGTEIVKYNESIYILNILLFVVILLLAITNTLFIVFLMFIPLLFLFSNELELIILTNDRVIVIKRTILEKIFRIQNETSIPLDQIVILTYSRAREIER
jgi:hypothetical protein